MRLQSSQFPLKSLVLVNTSLPSYSCLNLSTSSVLHLYLSAVLTVLISTLHVPLKFSSHIRFANVFLQVLLIMILDLRLKLVLQLKLIGVYER